MNRHIGGLEALTNGLWRYPEDMRYPAAGAVYRVSDIARLLGLDSKTGLGASSWVEHGFLKPRAW